MTDSTEVAATDAGERSGSAVPRPVEPNREALHRRLGEASHVLCCLDFDGTLAPIVERPHDAAMLPANRRAVETLVNLPDVTVAIVSGRELRDLEARVPHDVVLAGNHGLECRRPGEGASDDRRTVHPIARAAGPRIRYCCSLLSQTFSRFPGVTVEDKGLSGTVHYRTAPAALEPIVGARVRRIVTRFGGGRLELSSGKAIVEFAPAVDWGKGSLVELLQRDGPPGTVTLFLGDDTTDEHAFEAIEPDGIGVLVGESRPSSASFRLDRPSDVAAFLRRLADRRSTSIESPPA